MAENSKIEWPPLPTNQENEWMTCPGCGCETDTLDGWCNDCFAVREFPQHAAEI